jgi:hypothetical protein
MTTPFLYSEVTLPSIPQELLVFFESLVLKKEFDDIGYGLVHKKNNQLLKACSYSIKATDNIPLLNWFHSNQIPVTHNNYLDPVIINKPEQILIQTQTAHNEPSTHVVHSDIHRVFALNYMLSLGGDDVLTTWYQEKNMPLRRSKNKGQYGSPQRQLADTGNVEYANLEIIGSARFEKNKWYLLATDILHDVDNIVGQRSSITFGYYNDTILQILKKENLLTNIIE